MNTLLDTYDLAALLHISQRTISRWVHQRKIIPHKLPGTRKLYFDRHEVETQLQLPHLDTQPQPTTPPQKPGHPSQNPTTPSQNPSPTTPNTPPSPPKPRPPPKAKSQKPKTTVPGVFDASPPNSRPKNPPKTPATTHKTTTPQHATSRHNTPQTAKIHHPLKTIVSLQSLFSHEPGRDHNIQATVTSVKGPACTPRQVHSRSPRPAQSKERHRINHITNT